MKHEIHYIGKDYRVYLVSDDGTTQYLCKFPTRGGAEAFITTDKAKRFCPLPAFDRKFHVDIQTDALASVCSDSVCLACQVYSSQYDDALLTIGKIRESLTALEAATVELLL